MIVVYTMGSVVGHSAVAFTTTRWGPKFYSYVNTNGSAYWHPEVKSTGSWKNIVGRVLIPTKNDGNMFFPGVEIDENVAWEYYQNNPDLGNGECAFRVYSLLKACGAASYDGYGQILRHAWSPGALEIRANSMKANAIEKITAKELNGVCYWPDHNRQDLVTFFGKECVYRGVQHWWDEETLKFDW
jgi:hypothetical protein